MPNITQSQNVEDGFWTQVHLAVEHKLLVITLYLADFFFFKKGIYEKPSANIILNSESL